MANWLDELVDFYDFVWEAGVEAHSECINDALYEDFKRGGDKFETMKKTIVEKFPTQKAAYDSFLVHKET